MKTENYKAKINKNHLPLRAGGSLKVTMKTENYKAKINKNHLPLRVVGALKVVTMETENTKIRLIKITYHYVWVDYSMTLWKQILINKIIT